MRIIVATVLLLALKIHTFAQTYHKGKNLKQYEGEWLGVDGRDTFRIALKYKERCHLGNDLYVDAILGCYSYSENGVVTNSTMGRLKNLNPRNCSIFMVTGLHDGNNTMSFNEEGIGDRTVSVSFSLVHGTTDKAIWKMEGTIYREGSVGTVVDKQGNPLHEPRQIPKPTHESKITAKGEWLMTKIK